jgi:hypothetical protein
MQVTRISTTDTAKLIRKELKHYFPATKFFVRSHSYSGGSSINISWFDGPMQNEVDAIAKRFEGASFDGMTDMKDYHNSFVILEGSTLPIEVHYGADFVFTNRDMSAEYKAELIAKFEEISGMKYEDNESYELAATGLYAHGSWYEMPRMYGCQIVNRMSYIFPAQEKAVA